MTEKRYFKKEWEEEYYIFDSETVTERDFEEKLDYEGYRAFEDSMMGDDVVDKLNEQHETIQQCKKYNAKLYANTMNNDRQCLKTIKELEKENQHIKTTIREAYNNERTQIGKSVLKQLLENI